MKRKSYPSDLSEREWRLLEPLLPRPKPGGRPIKYARREMVNGIRYVLRTGCAWRMLPHDLPPWRTAFHYFRTWRRDGTLEEVHQALRDQVRLTEGREVLPARPSSTASRSRRPKGGPRGYDAGKRVCGRKRHIVVDTMGLLLAVAVHPADVQDCKRRSNNGPCRRVMA